MSERKIDEKYICDFFGIPDSPSGKKELEEIKKKLVKVTFENGKDIVRVNEDADGMYFLESGTAEVLNADGEQINIMHESQYFGEYGVLSGQKRLSTVRSLGKTVLYKLDSKDMMNIISKHPDIYGKLMKKVYGEVSNKHSQILALSGMRKGILQHPSNQVPMSRLHMLIQYGALTIIYILAGILVPKDSSWPLFLLPLILMLGYVLITKRTIESLIVAGFLEVILIYKCEPAAGYAVSLVNTMSLTDNAFTVLVMALMGGMVNLIVASGGVTAFKKLSDRACTTRKKVFFGSLGIMAVTSIDDGLNMMCASTATYASARKNGIIREKLGLFYSMLPTVLSSFIPMSLWGIFVIGAMTASTGDETIGLFCKSIPFNFFSILTVVFMILLGMRKLPQNKQLKAAEERYKKGGKLWPKGSEKYLNVNEPEVWGKIYNVIVPIVVLAIASLLLRSLFDGSFVLDSSCGLVAALIVMFIMYCAQGLMSPEQFMEHLITGISNSALPIIMYLLTICFSTLLETLSIGKFLSDTLGALKGMAPVMPAVLFVVSVLLTIALGSSWSMYAIIFPITVNLINVMGLFPALCIGAVAGAGIAGEKICMFTADALNVGTSIGCNPSEICKVRVHYSLIISGIATAGYLIAGIIAAI